MCIIAYIPSGIKVKRETMADCFLNNPDGAGFMYQDKKNNKVIIKKGYMTFKELWRDFVKTPYNVERVVHFRIATSGKVDMGCCHPFPLSDDYKEMRMSRNNTSIGIAHNGIISWTTPKDGMKAIYSDTMAFIANYMIPLKDQLFKVEIGDLISHATGSGKFAVMNADKVMLIGNFEMYQNAFFSNDSYKDVWARYRNTYYYNSIVNNNGVTTPYPYAPIIPKKPVVPKKRRKKDKESIIKGAYQMELDETHVTNDQEVDMDNPGSFRIAIHYNGQIDWALCEFLAVKLEDAGAYVDEYWIGAQNCMVFSIDALPTAEKFYGFEWYQLQDGEEEDNSDSRFFG